MVDPSCEQPAQLWLWAEDPSEKPAPVKTCYRHLVAAVAVAEARNRREAV